MNLSDYKPGDTDIVVDTSAHYKHDASCDISTNRSEEVELAVDVQFLRDGHGVVVHNTDGPLCVTIYNFAGSSVLQTTATPNSVIDLQELAPGAYYLQLRTANNIVVYRKFIRS
jgi:hypothetical protein